MNITSLAQATRTLTLAYILSMAIATPAHAVELVGKPVPVGESNQAQDSMASSSAQSSSTIDPSPETDRDPIAQEDSIQPGQNQLVQESIATPGNNQVPGFSMNPDLLIPVVAMSLLFGGPVLLLIVLSFLHYRAKALRQQNLNANIDKLLAAGRDIPIELLLGEEPTAARNQATGKLGTGDNSYMQRGVRNIGLGVGWLVFLTIVVNIKVGAFGFVIIGLGISQVVIWKLSSPTVDRTVRIQE